MGAWGTGNFENDDALDWVYELVGSDDLSVVLDETRSAISALLNGSELQELWEGTDDYDAWRGVVAGVRKRL